MQLIIYYYITANTKIFGLAIFVFHKLIINILARIVKAHTIIKKNQLLCMLNFSVSVRKFAHIFQIVTK